MNYPNEKAIKELREHYPVGARVELTKMDDSQAPPIGTKGTVNGVDDAGLIMVSWDNGSSLSIVYGEDSCRLIVGDFTDTVRKQILEVRDTGETNMFDINAVQMIANRMGFCDLVLFLIDHQKEYTGFILTGKM